MEYAEDILLKSGVKTKKNTGMQLLFVKTRGKCQAQQHLVFLLYPILSLDKHQLVGWPNMHDVIMFQLSNLHL